MDYEQGLRTFLATSKRLAESNPQDEAVGRTIAELQAQTEWMSKIEKPTGYKNPGDFGAASLKDDMSFIGEQVNNLRKAAEAPARNYQRIAAILGGLAQAVELAKRPQNAAVRPRLAAIVARVAGVFQEVDTVQDLEKPLEQIEKAVHGLYGDQGKNSTFYFDRRGKGHHSEPGSTK